MGKNLSGYDLVMARIGIIRISLTFTRLRLWMIVFMLHALRLVHAEYGFACYQDAVRARRAQPELCMTRYPLCLVHGIGFGDPFLSLAGSVVPDRRETG